MEVRGIDPFKLLERLRSCFGKEIYLSWYQFYYLCVVDLNEKSHRESDPLILLFKLSKCSVKFGNVKISSDTYTVLVVSDIGRWVVSETKC